jgi:alcohol dehydrogenase YqhD (iron-dependent ADH family)
MQAFDFHNPTRVAFGPGRVKRIGDEARTIGKKAFLVTGTGSARRSGAYDRVRDSLAAAGVEVVDFAGVVPNPRIEHLREAAAALKAATCDFVIGLGGGSVMDFAKAAAATPYYAGDPWDMFQHGQRRARRPERALPIVTIPTLAATASEMNDGAVLTNLATTEKSYVTAPCLYPALAVIDPELTVTVPPDQTANGAIDTITHALEAYFSGPDDTPLQDRIQEGIVHTVIEHAPRAVANGEDLAARTHLQWASVVALNGWAHAGAGGGFPMHFIEHVITAHTDVAHGAGLAVVGLGWMRVAHPARPEKYAQLARRVFAVDEADDAKAAKLLSAAYARFIDEIGAPTRLEELGATADQIDRLAEDTIKVYGHRGRIAGRPSLDRAGIVELLHACL